MGLDATVYKRIEKLEEVFGRGLFEVVGSTGEVQPRVGVGVSLPRGANVAIEKHLGNISTIGFLRGIVEQICGMADSLVLCRILYSGSHCGDMIEPNQFPQLRREIEKLKSQKSTSLRDFVDDLEALLSVAEDESNPIVF